ncbi:MAG: S8 family serine peptidase [Pseudolabrys sp.]|nr:S8 family serine peptidase [Pseudolabrys sp.]
MIWLVHAGGAQAQKYNGNGGSGGGNSGGGQPAYGKPDTTRSTGGGGGIGIISAIPKIVSPRDRTTIDRTRAGEPRKPRQPPQNTARRGPSGAPPANERRLVPDEVVVELSGGATPQQLEALQNRHQLTLLESQASLLSGTTLSRWRITDRRTITAVVQALEADAAVTSAQPNYLYSLQQAGANGGPAQYELAKLRLPQAHALAKGNGILIAVVDSGVDATHLELAGSVVGSFDAINQPGPLNKHGTSIAGLIAAHGTILGSAPAARLLAVRVFGTTGNGNTFDILKGLDYASANGARIINMSFAGPSDPITLRSLQAARKRGIVLVAAVGNAGPKSPPLYPGAYPEVIGVSGSDVNNKSSVFSNRGPYISVAAPGTDILVAIPDGGFEVGSGTSFSAAEVSGIVAMMLERRGDLAPDAVRRILEATAKDIGPKGRDVMFGAGLADAYGAVTADGAPAVASGLPIERVSTGVR